MPLTSSSDGRPALSTALTAAERKVVGLLALVQFVNVLDFMMVMPLGPDFSRDLGIDTSQLGMIGGSYTAAAAVSGLISAFVIDRFARKKALISVLTGLAFATLAGAFATGIGSLLAARVVAGAFGGPATALALAIVADSVPISKRGRALGIVMGAFSIASIVGVPAGLELARLGSWRTPFLGVGLLALATVAGAQVFMADLPRAPQRMGLSLARLREQFRDPDHLLSVAIGVCVMFSSFVVVPNVATYIQRNLAYPRERIGLMYLSGGLASLVSMQLAGRATDRSGARTTCVVGTGIAAVALYFGFARHHPWFHPILIVTLFMAGTSVRAIAYNTLTSRVPSPSERGSFMAIQSTVQHLASACGAFVSSTLLTSDGGGRLVGFERVAGLAIGLCVCVPVLVAILERRLDGRTVEPASGHA